jgi:alpha-tubulin suppressor-like RCC1 family protein
MSTNSLKELVDAIKTQGKNLAAGTTPASSNDATARDLVYLSTAVERLFGADAMLSMINEASKPAEVIALTPSSTFFTLTDEQVSRTVVKFSIGTAMTSTEVVVTAPTKGVAFVLDNSLPVPIKVKTIGQTTPEPTIAANTVGWVFCDGTNYDHVIDTVAVAAAATTALTTDGDMLIRASGANARLPVGSNSEYLVVDNGAPKWKRTGFRPHTRVKCMANHYIGRNPDDTWNKGGEYTEADGTKNATPTTISTVATHRLGNYIEDLTTFPFAANKGTWDIDQTPMNANYGAAVVTEDGGFMIWGAATSGRTGSINARDRTPFRPSLHNSTTGGIPLADVTNFKIKQVVLMHDTSYVVTTEGDVYATGYNGQSQLGDGGTSSRPYFRKIGFPSGAGPVRYMQTTQHEAENSTSAAFALMEDGDVYSWGDNGYGHLGHGDTTNRLQPTKMIAFDQNVRMISGGGRTMGVLTIDHKIFMWGENNEGQVGNGSTTDVYTPTEISIGGDCAKLKLSGQSASCHVHAIRADGKLYGWGGNAYGQIGDNSTTDRTTPTLISTLGQSTGFEVIDIWGMGGDWGFNYALTDNGNVYSWGHNTVGNLGLGDNVNKLVPTLNNNITWPSQCIGMGKSTVSTSLFQRTAIMSHANLADRIARQNGIVLTCGYAGEPLGRPHSGNQNVPQPIGIAPPMQGKLQWLTVSGYHTATANSNFCMALDEEGIMHMWGMGSNYSSGVVYNGSDTTPWQPMIL